MKYQKIVINACVLIIAVVVFEIVLQVTSRYISEVDLVTAVPIKGWVTDVQLGKRGNPRIIEYDSRGFRNEQALDESEIVTLGDSHTFGTNVQPNKNWPFVLSRLLNHTVYNISFGGYGPVQSYLNIELALSLNPKLIIYGFYFGNDFLNAYAFPKKQGSLKEFLSISQINEIHQLDTQDSISKKTVSLFKPSQEKQSSFRSFLSRYSKVWGMLRSLNQVLRKPRPDVFSPKFEDALKALSPYQLQYVTKFKGSSWKTILTAAYRKRALDDGDFRVKTGVGISKAVIRRMHSLAHSGGAEFLVVLLPTKESVFWPKISDRNKHPELGHLVTNEARLKKELVVFFRNEGIKYLDVLPDLAKEKDQTYFENIDGHPNSLGHKTIAQAIARLVGE